MFRLWSKWVILFAPKVSVKDHSIIAFAKYSEKQTFTTSWYAHVNKGVTSVSFTENVHTNLISFLFRISNLSFFVAFQKILWITSWDMIFIIRNMKKGFYLSQFAPNALFLYPLKNLRFSNVFGGRERMYWE